jgi:hypothetical protein
MSMTKPKSVLKIQERREQWCSLAFDAEWAYSGMSGDGVHTD